MITKLNNIYFNEKDKCFEFEYGGQTFHYDIKEIEKAIITSWNNQQKLYKCHTLAMDLFRTIYDSRYSSFGQSREQYKDKFYELLKTLKGE